MKRFVSVLTCVVMVFCLCSCSAYKKTENICIISSIFPSYDFARQITKGVDSIDVKMLITPGTEPHSYEPNVQDMASIKESDLFIYLGGESDEWVESLLDTFDNSEVNTLKMTDCVPLLTEEDVEGMQSGKEENELSADGERDEHVWTSPKNAVLISEKIKDELCKIDPENAQIYENNFINYKKELIKLDNNFRNLLSQNCTIIVADRFPFRYLAWEYGITYYAAFPGCSTESDPSAATMAFLEKKSREIKAGAVFYTEFSSQKVADTICEAIGAKKLMLHSCHNISRNEYENNETYISLMNKNLTNLQEALK